MKYLQFFGIIILFIVLQSCSEKILHTVYPTLSDGKYDSEFPYRSSSKQLKDISKCIKKVSSIAFYDIYEFDYEQKIKKSDLNEELIKNASKRSDVNNESIVGSATVIYKDESKIALLTCAHVISLQDTIFALFQVEDDPSYYVKSVSIKKHQKIFLPEFMSDESFEILAIDKKKDLAILGLYRSPDLDYLNLKVFDYPIGKAKNLEWGNFVYIMGYPMGYQMLTRGLVSRPERMTKDNFLIDAVFNHGFSGGAVLAVKDGVPNFEIVGIAKSASASYDNIITPEISEGKMIYSENLPYYGKLQVKTKESIKYGVTFSITMESIKRFYQKHKNEIIEKGYNLDDFFGI